MQQFKTAIKRNAKFIKKTVSSCFCTFKTFCKNIIPTLFSKTINFLRRSPRALAAIITVVLVVSCTAAIGLAAGTTTAYSVVYNGETIAMIKEPSVLAEAEIFAANKLNNPECTAHLIKTNLAQTITVEKNLVSSAELAETIIEHSEDIVTANVLKVDGDIVALGESNSEINTSIEAYISEFKNENHADNVEISNDLQVAEIYTLNSKTSSLPLVDNYLCSKVNKLSLQTVTSVVVEEEVPFETIETKNNKLSINTREVVQKGVKGTKQVTYKVYSLNGVETERVAEAEKVIKKPVVQKVIVGTKKDQSSATGNKGYSMCWPVKRVERSYVSSYLGDGRGHKGMDIVAPAGTPIYAAEDGTVTYSGWDTSGYGYKIIIKHSNGLETLYAHSSALYVRKGDVVVKGENIAAVGTTGRSTGNHLHFEVRKNGSIKNPVDYIGRN